MKCLLLLEALAALAGGLRLSILYEVVSCRSCRRLFQQVDVNALVLLDHYVHKLVGDVQMGIVALDVSGLLAPALGFAVPGAEPEHPVLTVTSAAFLVACLARLDLPPASRGLAQPGLAEMLAPEDSSMLTSFCVWGGGKIHDCHACFVVWTKVLWLLSRTLSLLDCCCSCGGLVFVA